MQQSNILHPIEYRNLCSKNALHSMISAYQFDNHIFATFQSTCREIEKSRILNLAKRYHKGEQLLDRAYQINRESQGIVFIHKSETDQFFSLLGDN